MRSLKERWRRGSVSPRLEPPGRPEQEGERNQALGSEDKSEVGMRAGQRGGAVFPCSRACFGRRVWLCLTDTAPELLNNPSVQCIQVLCSWCLFGELCSGVLAGFSSAESCACFQVANKSCYLLSAVLQK